MSLVRSECEALAPRHWEGHLEPPRGPAHAGLLPSEGEIVRAHEAVSQARAQPGVEAERHQLVLEATGTGGCPDTGGQVQTSLVTAVSPVE